MQDQNPTADLIPARVIVRNLGPILIWGIVLVLVLWFFTAFRMLLLTVLAAAAVACALWPMVQRVRRSRAISAMVVGVGFLAVLGSLLAITIVLLSGPIQREMQQLPETRQRLDEALSGLSTRFGVQPPVDSTTLLAQGGRWLGTAGNVALSVGQTLVGAGIALALILIGSVYLLAEPRDKLLGPVLPALPVSRQRQLLAAMDDLGPKLRWWLIGLVISMGVVAVISWIGYWMSGIKFALPLAAFSGFSELVPTIGPMIAGSVAVAVASTQGTGPAAGAAITWVVVQTLESYVILPLVMRRTVRMPAIVTLFSVILWGEVFGAPGLFMAIPLNLLIWSLFKHMIVLPREAAHSKESSEVDEDCRLEVERPTLKAPTQMSSPDAARELAMSAAHPT